MLLGEPGDGLGKLHTQIVRVKVPGSGGHPLDTSASIRVDYMPIKHCPTSFGLQLSRAYIPDREPHVLDITPLIATFLDLAHV